MKMILYIALVCALVFSSAAMAVEQKQDTKQINDPIEPVNRAIFSFNMFMDRYFMRPVARAYRYTVPKALRNVVHNVLNNLKFPLIFANQLLQGDFEGAGIATERFVINSVFGIGGISDEATKMGKKMEGEDFGQTLGKWGVGQGFYFVIPFLGPSSLRDGIGFAVDSFADPITLVSFDTDNQWITYSRTGLSTLDLRTRYLGKLEELERSSLDLYVTIRSIYAQRREAAINDGEIAKTVSPTINYEEDLGN